ncbi:MAG TPA: polysaccharide biosynthesis protein, partial [Bacilli bacterium]
SSMLKGATVLGVAAVISKLLGTLQKIPLQNIAGDTTFGIYSAVYPFYILILFLATAGFPVAVAKFVAERAAAGNMRAAAKVLAVSTVMLSILGAVFFCLMYFGAGMISFAIGSAQTKSALQSVSFALLFVPALSALRGYFQGLQDMMPTAVSQVAEQFIRVATMLVLLFALASMRASDGAIAAGATFGSVTGALAGLLVMLLYWKKAKREYATLAAVLRNHTEKAESWRELAGKLLAFALPVCLGSIVVPILNIVDTFTMPHLLKQSGFTENEAMFRLGLYNRGLTVVQLVSMLVISVSVAIVPAVAQAKAERDRELLRVRVELPVRLTWLFGLAASLGIAVLALPINVMLYQDGAGTSAMAIMAFTGVFSALNITTGSVLQGLGKVHIPAVHLLSAAVLKLVLNLALLPKWGIIGGALATVLAFALAAFLNMAALQKITGMRFSFSAYWLKPGLTVMSMVAAVAAVRFALHSWLPLAVHSERMVETVIALIGVGAGVAVFFPVAFAAGAISGQDLQAAPALRAKLAPLFRRLERG